MKPVWGMLALFIMALAWMAGCSRGMPAALHVERQVTAIAQAVSATLTGVATQVSATPAALSTEVKPPAEAREAVRRAIEDLGKTIGERSAAIRLLRVEAVQWSDTSLGCPKEGMVYAQVITPGFLVVLEAKGRAYEYHTDADSFVTLCEP